MTAHPPPAQGEGRKEPDAVWIMVRCLNPLRWEKRVVVVDFEAAENYWRSNIKGRGVTAWTMYVSPEDGARMLREPDFKP